jgi:formylglycine-generating enzyme required for sulfatase activity
MRPVVYGYALCGLSILVGSAYLGTSFAERRSRTPPAASAALLGDRQHCGGYTGLPPDWGVDPHAGMQRVDGARFQLGSLRGYAQERPLVDTRVDAFWIDRTEVSNAQFASFVAATGYVTDAERGGGAAVFRVDAETGRWWQLSKDANWRHPEGNGSDIAERGHEPVVDVTYADALAYAHWLHRELPTEAQWEFAAKAGRTDEQADRSLRDAKGHPLANFWQGLFPVDNSAEDGFAGRAPVGCYASNPFGLYDMVGNVWEWTTTVYESGHAVDVHHDDLLLAVPGRDTTGARPIQRVIKGGSYLCSADYCMRARAASRQPEEADLPASHIGFRTVAVDD